MSRRRASLIGFVGAVGLVVPALAAHPAAAAGPSISINDPARAGQPKAGTVELSGKVAEGSSTTTVLYVLDATASTHLSAGSDCNGDGTASAADDENADGAVGDVLDCEIGAVRKLNTSLISSYPGATMMVGVEAFAQLAEVADLNLSGTEIFAAPGDTSGESQPRIIMATTSVQRGAITRYTAKSLGASGASYDSAVSAALAAFDRAPAGPKWIMLLSDGKTGVADSTLSALHSAGVHLSSFAVGSNANCRAYGALAKMSAATGERCVTVPNPANLAAQLTNAQPDGIANVSVAIGDTAVAADIDPVGGWRARFTLGKGSFTATATATLTSGGKISASRSFTVGAAAGGPPPGTVTGGPGSHRATAVFVHRPKPSRTALPSEVTGSVGVPRHGTLVPVKHLNGARVLLQGRSTIGGAWVTLGRAKVHHGSYVLGWDHRWGIHYLQVTLEAHRGLARSSQAVPSARISGCSVRRHAKRWSMTCHTTAKTGALARIYQGSHVVDRARVSGGLVTVHAAGKPAGHELVVKLSRKRHAHMARLSL